MGLRRHANGRADAPQAARRRPSVELYAGDFALVEPLKTKSKSIWVVGGAAVVKDFLRANLADEIRLAIMPIVLGDGLPFFDYVGREQPLHLKDVTAYESGLVEIWYEIGKAGRPDRPA